MEVPTGRARSRSKLKLPRNMWYRMMDAYWMGAIDERFAASAASEGMRSVMGGVSREMVRKGSNVAVVKKPLPLKSCSRALKFALEMPNWLLLLVVLLVLLLLLLPG